jgi:formylglycine-generating enzyme required for sulfatase activity
MRASRQRRYPGKNKGNENRMTIKNALVDVAFDDLDTAIAWYGKLVGRAPDKQSIPTDAEWFSKGGLDAGLRGR